MLVAIMGQVDMKPVFLAIIYAALAEGAIYHFATSGYSGALEASLISLAIVGAIALGIFATSPFMAFCGAMALAAPAISYMMLGYGILEMCGFFHAFSFGAVGAAAYKVTHGFRIFPPTRKSADGAP